MFFVKRKLMVLVGLIVVTAVVTTCVNQYLLQVDKMPEKVVPNEVQSDAFKSGEKSVDERNSVSDVDEMRGLQNEMSVKDEIRLVIDKNNNNHRRHMPTTTTSNNNNNNNNVYIPPRRVVHFDLKGAPPKVEYFATIFPLLKSAGATTLLFEYEDMFPFGGILKNISALNAYTKQQIKRILSLAKREELEVIPLVQTFGHLEFALKLEEFIPLREEPRIPQAICPSKNSSWTLIREIVDQVMELHVESGFLHIGCDEVFHMGVCPVCSSKISGLLNDPENDVYQPANSILFLEHVKKVGEYVKEKWKVQPIIWDDMLRTVSLDALIKSDIGSVVEPMVWVYVEQVDRFVDPMTWNKFSAVFDHVWTAGAFKGAFGETLYLTNTYRHAQNQLSWLQIMLRESLEHDAGVVGDSSVTPMTFRGLVLTGWSRYNHFAVLCELLPSSLPSLILNLVIIREGDLNDKVQRETLRLLQCDGNKLGLSLEQMERDPNQMDFQNCKFPGNDVVSILNNYHWVKANVRTTFEKLAVNDGWMTDYNVKHAFTSVDHVEELMRSVSYLPRSLSDLEERVKSSFKVYFDKATINEWLEQHIWPLQDKVNELKIRGHKLLAKDVWPRRPLISDHDRENE